MTPSAAGDSADVSDPQPQISDEEAAEGSENDAGANGNRLIEVNGNGSPSDPFGKVNGVQEHVPETERPSTSCEAAAPSDSSTKPRKRAAAKSVMLAKKSKPPTTEEMEDGASKEGPTGGAYNDEEAFEEAVSDFVHNELMSPDSHEGGFVVSDDSNLNNNNTVAFMEPDEEIERNSATALTSPGPGSDKSPITSPSKKKVPPPSRRFNANGEETTVWKDYYFVPGLLVYCPWPGKNPNHEPWYWGVIRRRYNQKANKYNVPHYSIKFVDGDFLPEIRSTNLQSHGEYCRFIKEERMIRDDPPEGWKERLTGVLADEAEIDGNYTIEELYQNRCQECSQCKRRECGECDACFVHKINNPSTGRGVCCFQKMCERIDVKKKAQSCLGLPDDWRFIFTAAKVGSEDKGLVLLAPDGDKYDKIELAQRAYPEEKFDEVSISTSLGLYQSIYPEKDDEPEADEVTTSALSLEELWNNRCQDCHNCNREDCGKCASCIQNEGGGSKACCLRRFCCSISVDKKAQQAPYFPRGWRYYFDPVEYRRYPHYDGLGILAPNGNRKYQNIESAINHNKTKLDLNPHPSTFYDHVGLEKMDHIAAVYVRSKPREKVSVASSSVPSIKMEEEPITRAALKEHVPSANLEELAKERCNNCVNCTREECKNCDSCYRNLEKNTSECCIRRICCKVPEDKKALQAPYFPKGWLFFFDPEMNTKLPNRDGMVILAPNGRRYQSVENAMNHNPTSIMARVPDARTFYVTVGLPSRFNDILVGGAKKRRSSGGNASEGSYRKRPKAEDVTQSETVISHADINFDPAMFEEGPCTLKQLFQMKCGTCEMCQKDDCKLCAACRRNSSLTCRDKEICVRKMCAEISPGKKRQAIDGFPKGWYVYFEPPKENDIGLRIISTWGLVYSSMDNLRRYTQLDKLFEKREAFSAQVGPLMVPIHDNILLGLGFSREWINSHGQRLHLSGVIRAVQYDAVKGDYEFKVVWDEHSCDLVNGLYNVCKFLQVPKTECFQETNALGGHYLDNSKRGREEDSRQMMQIFTDGTYHESWLVPDLSHESSDLDGETGDVVPVLTMVFRGFQLVFRAKKSTIPNAGYGVFVTVKSMRGETHFELEPGQLLDIGVYAPFTADMRKSDHVFLLKNFLLKMKAEEYCFNTHADSNDTVYDIVDDVTGQLHAEARRHIPPFVNEICTGAQQTVHAKHDPQGALHYLLGHSHGSDTFRLPADGVTETEIFMDYGADYETVRVREGYSRLPQEEAAEKLKHLEEKEEVEFLTEIRSFSINELKTSLDWLMSVFEATQPVIPSQEYKWRSLLVAILMKKRYRAIEKEFHDLPEGDESGNEYGGWSDVSKRETVKREAGKIISLLFEGYDDNEAVQKVLAGGKFATLLGDELCNSELSPSEFRAMVEAL